jgi:hypothetical protein
MTASTRRAVSRLTDCCASDDLAAAARRTGGVKRPANITGQIVRALVPCGVWREAKTTRAPLAATVPPWGEPLEGSPEARHHRLHKRAPACLPERLRQALAHASSSAQGGEDGLLPDFPQM